MHAHTHSRPDCLLAPFVPTFCTILCCDCSCTWTRTALGRCYSNRPTETKHCKTANNILSFARSGCSRGRPYIWACNDACEHLGTEFCPATVGMLCLECGGCAGKAAMSEARWSDLAVAAAAADKPSSGSADPILTGPQAARRSAHKVHMPSPLFHKRGQALRMKFSKIATTSSVQPVFSFCS